MIVVDASALLEVILRTPAAKAVEERLFVPRETLHAPHLIDVEVAQAMRRLVQAKEITLARAHVALSDFEGLVIERHAHRPLFRRVWGLRTSLSAYDATYVALAEALAVPMLTCDDKLARAHGHNAKIEVVPVDS